MAGAQLSNQSSSAELQIAISGATGLGIEPGIADSVVQLANYSATEITQVQISEHIMIFGP